MIPYHYQQYCYDKVKFRQLILFKGIVNNPNLSFDNVSLRRCTVGSMLNSYILMEIQKYDNTTRTSLEATHWTDLLNYWTHFDEISQKIILASIRWLIEAFSIYIKVAFNSKFYRRLYVRFIPIILTKDPIVQPIKHTMTSVKTSITTLIYIFCNINLSVCQHLFALSAQNRIFYCLFISNFTV